MAIHKILLALSLTAASIFTSSLPASARGGTTSSHDEWNPAHMAGLPPEARAEVKRIERACNAPLAARHLFELSRRNQNTGENFIALHFDRTNCANEAAICSPSGCLHEVFVSKGAGYRLMLSEKVEELKFEEDGGRVWLSVECSSNAPGCSAHRVWNGKRFVPAP